MKRTTRTKKQRRNPATTNNRKPNVAREQTPTIKELTSTILDSVVGGSGVRIRCGGSLL